jgi:dienelactone hydrolase
MGQSQVSRLRGVRAWSLGLLLGHAVACGLVQAAEAQTVRFMSRDGATELVGYLFLPEGRGPFPAVVMLHGRGGAYSSLARGHYSAETLSRRHKQWGWFWAGRGYAGLHVDSFGPRGYAAGFPLNSYRDRPAGVNEQTIRPLDAYGALDYLRARTDVSADRIAIQGWSNAAMAVLAALETEPAKAQDRFAAALAFYPGCRAQAARTYYPYAPLLLLSAEDDEEVSSRVCERLAEAVKERGKNLQNVLYPGAQHGFDDPGSAKQARAANRAATKDARGRAEQFFALHVLGAGAR